MNTGPIRYGGKVMKTKTKLNNVIKVIDTVIRDYEDSTVSYCYERVAYDGTYEDMLAKIINFTRNRHKGQVFGIIKEETQAGHQLVLYFDDK